MYSKQYFTIYFVEIIIGLQQSPGSYQSSFQIDNVIYTLKRKPAVVNLCPYVPIDEKSERSCYSILLLHTPWPSPQGEDGILPNVTLDTAAGEATTTTTTTTAIEQLRHLQSVPNGLPEYVYPLLVSVQKSDNFITNQGQPCSRLHVNESHIDNDIANVDNSNEIIEDGYLSDSDTQFDQPVHEPPTFNPTVSNHTIQNISTQDMKYFNSFLQVKLKGYNEKFISENQISATDNDNSVSANTGIRHIVRVNNYEYRRKQHKNEVKLLSAGQRRAYHTIKAYITGDKEDQLLMFLSGEGGTGKSRVLKLIIEFTRLHHGKQLGTYGAVLALAPTGCSANNIDAITYHRALAYRRSDKLGRGMSANSARESGKRLQGVQLIVLDEVSLLSCEQLDDVSTRVTASMSSTFTDPNEREAFMQDNKPMGGIHTVLSGDFHQLAPVASNCPLFQPPHDGSTAGAKRGHQIWLQLNEYDELTECLRFKDWNSAPLPNFLHGARVGKFTCVLPV